MVENFGPYYEDLQVGEVLKSKIGRTLTEFDNIWFTLLTNNSNQIHFNIDYTKKYYQDENFKGRLVINGLLTLSVAIGQTVGEISSRGFMLSIENVKFIKPVFPGDTIYSETQIVEKRESKSMPRFGIVKVHTKAINQDGVVVLELDRTIMVPKREYDS